MNAAGGTRTEKLVHSALRFQKVLGWQPEDRKPDDYRKEVEAYLGKLREEAFPTAISRAVRREGSRLSVRLENPTDFNFLRLKLVLHAEGEVFGFDPEDEESLVRLPSPPRLWGTMRPPARLMDFGSSLMARPFISPRISVPRSPTMWIDNSGSATIEFAAFDLRPRAAELLDPFVLLAGRAMAGQTAQVVWEATSTSADGVASGSLPVRVADDPLTLEELLHESVDGEEA